MYRGGMNVCVQSRSAADWFSFRLDFALVFVMLSNWRSLTTVGELEVMAVSVAHVDKVIFTVSDDTLCSSNGGGHVEYGVGVF